MKKLIIILISIFVTACSSTPKNTANNQEKLCRTYSNNYVAVAAMKERGFTRKQSLACSLSPMTKNSEKICNRKLPDNDYMDVIRFNKTENKVITTWMASIVYNVYSSPNKEVYQWRDHSYKQCKNTRAI
jgi:hypothetical protein